MSIDFQKIQEDAAATRQMVNQLLEYINKLPTSATSQTSGDTPLNVAQAADFLNVSKQTIYQNINQIPHRKRHGKLYFFRNELTEYLNKGF